jgi:uncharacterized protein YyaL (SSP411 family)
MLDLLSFSRPSSALWLALISLLALGFIGEPAAVGAEAQIAVSSQTRLADKEREALSQAFDDLYDSSNAGWGTEHKYLDAPSIEWSFAKLDAGDQTAVSKIRHTLDANRNLIDPVWGGVYQYSDSVDWQSPHYEKLLSFQADDLRTYSDAYSRWHRQTDLKAAQQIEDYLVKFLAAPDGGFYVSQDADVSEQITGHDFYSKDDAGRRAIGMPRIDTHEYAREAGWAIRALCKYYDVTGDAAALSRAESGAKWALGARKLPGGGFSHGSEDQGGPFLDDNVAMAQAFVALYRSTGARQWLTDAVAVLDFIEAKLRDPRGGYRASLPVSNGHGVFREPVRDVGQNAALVRAANMIQRYTGAKRPRLVAEHGMKLLVAFASAQADQFRPEILVADREVGAAPIHITIVGPKSDSAAQALHAAALSYPGDYLQVDWWDRSEGKLPDPTISYPELKVAAAFACTANACSTPVYEPSELVSRVRSVLD